MSKWVLGAIFAVVLGICIIGAALAIATGDDPDVDVNLGDDEFRIEDIDAAAARIAEDGPDIYPDLVGGNRPILVNHVGGQVDEGWVAVIAVAPGSEACLVDWDADAGAFRDCEGETYPADGTGLDEVSARVEGDTLVIDLGRGRG